MSNSLQELEALNQLKRKLRSLKKLELKLCYGDAGGSGNSARQELVWDTFFDLTEPGTGRARYSLRDLSCMDKAGYRQIVDAFISQVFIRYCCCDNQQTVFHPVLLDKLGLPPGSDQSVVKKKFHELAMKAHPDTGGDHEKFIQLMAEYRKLTGR